MAYLAEPRVQLGYVGTFDDGLGARKRKPKKKKRPSRFKRVLKRVGKIALKAAPIVGGIVAGPVGGLVIGGASGAIGRGKPKLRNILRGAAIGGATGFVARTPLGKKVLVKGKSAAGKLLKAGGRGVKRLGKGVGSGVKNIAKGKIGPKEVAILAGAGGLAAATLGKKLLKDRQADNLPIETPEGPLPPDVTPPGLPPDEGPGPYPGPDGPGPIEVEPPPQTGGGTPGDVFAEYRAQCEAAGGTFSVKNGRPMCKLPNDAPPPTPGPEGPPSPPTGGPTPGDIDVPPAGGPVPTAGGEVPDTATNALLPGTGDDPYRPFVDSDNDGIPDEEEAAADNKKKGLLIVAGIAAVILLTRKKRKAA